MAEETRLDALKRKLAAREREPAFATNVEELRREIERLGQETPDDQD